MDVRFTMVRAIEIVTHPKGYFDPHAAHPHVLDLKNFPRRVFIQAMLLTGTFAGVEALSGWYFNSLALWGDAGHMFSDLMALIIAAVAQRFAQQGPSMRHSYGLGRLEIMAAFFNAMLMLCLVIGIVWEALHRLKSISVVDGWGVMAVSLVGLLVNVWVMMLFKKTRSQNLNVKAVLIHVLGDLLGSLAAFLSGIAIVWKEIFIMDPILSLVICALIAFSSFRLIKDAVHVLMEGVPAHLDLEVIGQSLAEIQGVRQVHDLHIWALSSGTIALSVHVILYELMEWPHVHQALKKRLNQKFKIFHTTIQPEVHGELGDHELNHVHQYLEDEP